MSPVTLAELNPDTRARVLEQLSEGGLSKQQRQILEFVRAHGYITVFDAKNSLIVKFNCDCDFDKPQAFRRYMASLNVCASRSLARLVERGLLVKVKRKYISYSDVFVSPDNTDAPPLIKRRTLAEESAFTAAGFVERLTSKLTVAGAA
jgi:hypothetical protein